MTATFLDRNKKKSLLAALLLFLRQRKMLVLLLFLVLAASTVFLGPSTWITGFPGGKIFAADVAWIASKMGYDVSRWGLGTADKRSYEDLLAAFRAARAGGTGAGWSAFFGRGKAAGGSDTTTNSLDFVKGSKADLARRSGGGAGAGAQSVAEVVDPSDPKNRGGGGVTISEADLGGQREGYVKAAFAGGFLNGLFGGSHSVGAGDGDGALSGGAYASKGFFSGTGGAAGSSNSLARGAVAGLPAVATPAGVKGGAARGSLSAMGTRALTIREQKGVLGAGALGGNLAYTQLAEGASRDELGTTYCKAPGCPSEYATTNTGAIYDGNTITSGFLTSSDPGANSSGLINSTVDVPPDNSGGSAGDAQNMQACAGLVQQCEQSKTAPMQQIGADETQLGTWFGQIAGACGDPCHCGPCNALESQITGLCNGDLKTQMGLADAQCAPLPDYCGALGFTGPSSSQLAPAALDYCKPNLLKCGPDGLLAQLACFFGS